MNIINRIAYILTIIGGLNWGLVGLSGFNLVSFLFGDLSAVSQMIYILVGLSALILLFAPFSGKNA